MRVDLFANAVAFEVDGDIIHATMLYEQILKAGKDARAAVNLGTIHYTRKEYVRAAELYRQATEIAPGYALAFCNLGNALEECGRVKDAVKAYQQAISISPQYSDAHYNLAMLLDLTAKEPRRAIKHWRTYVKLDPDSHFATYARSQIRRTISLDRLSIVWRRDVA